MRAGPVHDLPFPSVILILTCGHHIHMILDDDADPDPWQKYDRSRYQDQHCVMRECRRFGIKKHPVAKVKPYYPRRSDVRFM